MKKYLPILVILSVIATFGIASANGNGMISPPPGEPTEVFNVVNGVVDGPATLAAAGIEGGYDAYCNQNHAVPIMVHASMAQWARVVLSWTRMDWQILKPGDYAAPTTCLLFKSNGDLIWNFEEVGSLQNVEGDLIPTYYAIMPIGVRPTAGDWIPAPALNDPANWVFLEEVQNHSFICREVWVRLVPFVCDSACEYQDDWILTVTLAEQKPWVDNGDVPPPPPI